MKSNELNAIVEELRTNSDDTRREMSLCQERTLHTIRKEKEDAERELNGLMNDLSCIHKNKLGRLQTLNNNLKPSWKNLKQPEVLWMKLK